MSGHFAFLAKKELEQYNNNKLTYYFIIDEGKNDFHIVILSEKKYSKTKKNVITKNKIFVNNVDRN